MLCRPLSRVSIQLDIVLHSWTGEKNIMVNTAIDHIQPAGAGA